MSWCFAIVNNRLAEIYFNRSKGRVRLQNHCYVKRQEFKTKREQKWTDEDTARFRFTFRKGKYKRIRA